MAANDTNMMAGPPAAGSAVALLRFDHERVGFLFVDYEAAQAIDEKRAIVDKILSEWSIHTQLEHEIFYPVAKEVLKEFEYMSSLAAAHTAIDALIAALMRLELGSEEFDANMRVLGKQIKMHSKEEQGQLFQRVKASSIDLRALGAQLKKRKQELLEERAAVQGQGAA